MDKTAEELREEFLDYIRSYIGYWLVQNMREGEKLQGMAFSILNMIDGTTDLPPMDLYIEGKQINDGILLHELLFNDQNDTESARSKD